MFAEEKGQVRSAGLFSSNPWSLIEDYLSVSYSVQKFSF